MIPTIERNSPTAVPRLYCLSTRPTRYTQVSMMSAVSMTRGLYRLNIWSKPAFSTLGRFMMVTSIIVGRIPGKVICHTRLNRLAPSMAAASYNPGAIPDKAAR